MLIIIYVIVNLIQYKKNYYFKIYTKYILLLFTKNTVAAERTAGSLDRKLLGFYITVTDILSSFMGFNKGRNEIRHREVSVVLHR